MRMIMANTPKEPKYRSRFVATLEFAASDDSVDYEYFVYDSVTELEDLQATLDWLNEVDPDGCIGMYDYTGKTVELIYADARFQRHFGKEGYKWPEESDAGPMAFRRVEYSWWDHHGVEYAIVVERGE